MSGKTLLRAVKNLSHDDAVQYVLDQVNEHIYRSGVYRVSRLFIPGDVSISYTPGRHTRDKEVSGYHVIVRDRKGSVLYTLNGLEISHAILDLLSIWEEEPHEGPGIVS